VRVQLAWRSDGVSHRDVRVLPGLRREDCTFGTLFGDPISWAARPQDGLEGLCRLSHDPALERHFARDQLPPPLVSSGRIRPGTHLPVQWLSREAVGNFHLARCLGQEDDGWRFDFNHPLAGRDVTISLADDDLTGTGPSLERMRQAVFDTGPGLQAWRTDSLLATSPADYARQDETPDSEFYKPPRFVHHIDSRARTEIGQLYARAIPEGGKVLDLMTSWVSHLPEALNTKFVAGVGMNAEELTANPRLDRCDLQDLNQRPVLPFDDSTFDTVICTVSLEYLVDPAQALGEAGRVLRPGGHALIAFSNRCFPTKAIRIWGELQEFERMTLVTAWFQQAGCFEAIETTSLVGFPRPDDDPYAEQSTTSDPVYLVAASRT